MTSKKNEAPVESRGLPPTTWLIFGIALFTLVACSAYLWLSVTQGFTPA